jgi:hypothetical protein
LQSSGPAPAEVKVYTRDTGLTTTATGTSPGTASGTGAGTWAGTTHPFTHSSSSTHPSSTSLYDFAGLALLSYQDTVAYLGGRDEEELTVGARRLHPADALVHGVLTQREGERAQCQVRILALLALLAIRQEAPKGHVIGLYLLGV